jgi:hypothetical protein
MCMVDLDLLSRLVWVIDLNLPFMHSFNYIIIIL